MLHIIYRSYGGENLKNRPDFYSKLVCLYSFIDSVLMIDEEVKLIFMNDGPIQDDKIEVMKKYGDIISLPSLGNSPSFREALNLALNLSDSDLVYFAEDDYLYKPEAFKNMLLAFKELPNVDYITLFDHSDRYIRKDDSLGGKCKIFITINLHWRTCESTCMTFGARVSTFKKDKKKFYSISILDIPEDRILWRFLLGQKKYFYKFPKRILVSPIPSLCSHIDLNGLAPIVDWGELSTFIREKYSID